jgi:tetratricopeptide (TPR) repeat protein
VLLAVVIFGVGITGLFLGLLGEPSPEQTFEKALAHREGGEFAATIIELKNALRQDPKNTKIRISLGNTYMQLSDFTGAEKEYRRALKFGAPAEEVLEPLARALQLQEKYDQVLEEIWPDLLGGIAAADIYVARGRAYASIRRLEKAQEAYHQALQIAPQHLPALIETARLEIELSDEDEANQTLRRVQALSPQNLEAMALQGDLYLKTGKYAEAVDQYKLVLTKLPGHVLTKVALAEAYFRQGLDDEAAKLLDEALLRLPGNFNANYLSAAIAIKNEEFETALKRAERALFSDPGHVPSLAIAGSAAFALGQAELAERNLGKVVAQVPDHKVANRLLSVLRERRTATPKGKSPLENGDRSFTHLIDDTATPVRVASAIDTNVSDRQVLEIGRAYLRARQRPTADASERIVERAGDLAEFRRLLESDGSNPALERMQAELIEKPNSPQVRALLAEYHLIREQAAEAYRLIALDLDRVGNIREILVIGAIASLSTNRADIARLALRELIERELPSAEMNYLLALAYRQLGNDEAYHETLSRSLSIDPRYAPALAERVRLALGQGRLDEAERDAQILESVWPNNPVYFDLVAGLALLRDETEAAAQLYRRALGASPTSVRVLRLAYAAQRSGDTAESKYALQDWLGRNPDDTTVALALANKYVTANELVDAAELYSIVLRQRPNNVVALNNIAWVSLELGDQEAALKFARQGLGLAPDSVELLDTLAEVHISDGNYAAALPLLQRAANREQANPDLQVKLARALAQNGSRGQAVTLLRQTLDAHREFPNRIAAERLLVELDQ